jgi:hypothetical protein
VQGKRRHSVAGRLTRMGGIVRLKEEKQASRLGLPEAIPGAEYHPDDFPGAVEGWSLDVADGGECPGGRAVGWCNVSQIMPYRSPQRKGSGGTKPLSITPFLQKRSLLYHAISAPVGIFLLHAPAGVGE